MSLVRSTKAKRAKSAFYHEYNEIDIYIEDTAIGYKKIFRKLMSRYFEGSYKVSDVFPLGGRDQVLKACGNDQQPRKRPRLYIVDGDLYLLLGESIQLQGLYVLPRYCVENHLICPNALTQILEEEAPESEYEQLEDKLDFIGWINANKMHLIELFIVYAVAKKLTPTIQTVAFGYKGLISSGDGEVDATKVRHRIESLSKDVISLVGQKAYEKEYEEISSKVSFKNSELLTYISAKDILMPLLTLRLQRTTKFKVSNLTLKHRLSNRCAIESFNGLDKKVFAA
ncbi:DUF4435 domain-containing protein [Vibrio splendidus]|uniref:DUF4435 domain-containing protein n=1 Tax=Vibrio splendidus TaxID=29497 RepID=UPI00352C2D91